MNDIRAEIWLRLLPVLLGYVWGSAMDYPSRELPSRFCILGAIAMMKIDIEDGNACSARVTEVLGRDCRVVQKTVTAVQVARRVVRNFVWNRHRVRSRFFDHQMTLALGVGFAANERRRFEHLLAAKRGPDIGFPCRRERRL